MFERTIIAVLLFVLPSMVAAQTAEEDAHGGAFANAVWAHIQGACSVEVELNDELNAEIYEVLDSPIQPLESRLPWDVVVARQNASTPTLQDVDKRAIALTVVGTIGVAKNLEFVGLFADPSPLNGQDFVNEAEPLRSRAEVLLQFMRCLWPNAEGVRTLADTRWGAMAEKLFVGECDTQLFVLFEAYHSMQLVPMAAENRLAMHDALIQDHDQYLEASRASFDCEDFS